MFDSLALSAEPTSSQRNTSPWRMDFYAPWTTSKRSKVYYILVFIVVNTPAVSLCCGVESHAKQAFPSIPACHVTPPPLPAVFSGPSFNGRLHMFHQQNEYFLVCFSFTKNLRFEPSDCENRPVSRNVSLVAHQPPDAAATPTNIYSTYGYIFTVNPGPGVA
jgi:hypothetical protein